MRLLFADPGNASARPTRVARVHEAMHLRLDVVLNR